MIINGTTTITPIIVFIDDEVSLTIAKFFVTLANGEKKEYILKTTKEGKLILN